MNLEELLAMLELDTPDDFEYFENFADVVESEEEIPEETLYELFSQVEPDTTVELVENYFEELLDAMPDDYADIFVLLENIKRVLMGLAQSEEESGKVYFSEELARFIKWYGTESEVSCIGQESREEKVLPLKEALVISRLEKLDGEEYGYDFSSCMDYEIDEFIMNFAVDEVETEEDED